MNKKTAVRLRNMANVAATNCIPQHLQDPNERRRFEVNVGGFTYEKTKKMWGALSIAEKRKFGQRAVDDIAHQLAFPPKKKEKKPRKKVVKTKNKVKSEQRRKKGG